MTDTTTTKKPLEVLTDYVQRSTEVFRKGDIVTEIRPEGSHVDVVIIDGFPKRPLDRRVIDCHFVYIGLTEALAELSHEEFYDLVLSAKNGIFTTIDAGGWKRGPSYIEIGGWLGDQTLAFKFMACVEAHEMGEIVTPARLGITGPLADDLAGKGYVMITGLRDPRLPAQVNSDPTVKGAPS
jgi:hypothetical protein